MSLIASVRPGEQNLPLFLHVLGAMVMVGGFVLAFTSLGYSIRNGQVSRLGFRALLYAALPGYVVMRGAAEWIYSKEFPKGSKDPAWIGIGYGSADFGLLMLLIALGLAGFGLRRARRDGGGGGMVRAATVLVGVILLADLIAIFAMTTKPS
jgi:hypothetical protein